MALFKKAACFTDIHFGMKSGSRTHNTDCENFVKWFCEEAKAQGAETCIFLGDWHHNRATTDVSTMNYTVSNLERLNNTFEKVYFMVGNHDLFYKDKREINSIEFMRLFPNIVPIVEQLTEGDVTLLPWLVGEEWKKVGEIQSRYVFGHFELPYFKMNAMVEMPDHGEIQVEYFGEYDQVFSGHFHLRQTKRNVTYIGNAFPHNFSDAGDDQRGCMILEWGQEPRYQAWPGQPLYNVWDLSYVMDHAQEILRANMHVRVQLDIEISYEEANLVRDTYVTQYGLREMALIPNKRSALAEDLAPGEVRFESVDQIVTDQITKIESDFYDPKLLLQIYQSL